MQKEVIFFDDKNFPSYAYYEKLSDNVWYCNMSLIIGFVPEISFPNGNYFAVVDKNSQCYYSEFIEALYNASLPF
jgi:hypothetical protein